MRPLRPGCTLTGDGMLSIRSTAVANELIVRSVQIGEDFRIPPMRAARDGLLNLFMAHGGGAVSAKALKLKQPTMVILADDHPTATGPEAWPQARKLARWANLVALHATGGQPAHYDLFTSETIRHGRMLVVELDLRHLAAWLGLVRRERRPGQILCLTPLPGGQHPISPTQAGEAVQ